MKLRIFVLYGISLLLFVLTGCTRVNINTEPEVSYVVFQDAVYKWVVVIKKVTYFPNNPPGAIIKIRNNLDRNLTLDFDGPSHYRVSIGDKSEYTLEVKEGSYKVMAAAPGLKFIPYDVPYYYSDRWLHEQVWIRKELSTSYRK